ncbi:MAG: 2-C-methyl-D-erythritol 4-phosphate cytidylyltransferase [Lunatimonas sp.]|uniref:2-C-methyl-D-erythritol 4-phosphate cytidylyltransferase n=1 Tax=Lunatimonas sp. TaxID=2060141 RepID=UPI00263A5458|nr:2-C-methyl-D-erythritol 4-phosphate cytidylyltransferase [Lunatimonas sp.]MCC5936956.1 2-C-methyl-D-erythritol 4-phosphate cytidylyltransferase [Lunatimonas sp.]
MIRAAIIVAGGSGSRMGAPLAKQFIPLGGVPILMHTLRAFHAFDASMQLILVLPEKDKEFWEDLCRQHQFRLPHQVVAGGQSRFQSVRNGLASVREERTLVAIHDGVRPFVAQEVIRQSFEEADRSGSAIPVVPLKDSLRKVEADGQSVFQDRQAFRLVQTPQTFQVARIKKAFLVAESAAFTDDATVYEHQGWQVNLISGDPNNIKITTPEDLRYAEFLIGSRIV